MTLALSLVSACSKARKVDWTNLYILVAIASQNYVATYCSLNN